MRPTTSPAAIDLEEKKTITTPIIVSIASAAIAAGVALLRPYTCRIYIYRIFETFYYKYGNGSWCWRRKRLVPAWNIAGERAYMRSIKIDALGSAVDNDMLDDDKDNAL